MGAEFISSVHEVMRNLSSGCSNPSEIMEKLKRNNNNPLFMLNLQKPTISAEECMSTKNSLCFFTMNDGTLSTTLDFDKSQSCLVFEAVDSESPLYWVYLYNPA